MQCGTFKYRDPDGAAPGIDGQGSQTGAGANATDRFAAPNVNAALGTDSAGVYQKVLSIPFYFTTALQVFDPTIPPLVDATDEKKLKSSLVAAFIEKKLQVTKNARRYPAAQTLAWLTWLSVFLKSKSQVTFELSDLQPSDLKRGWQYRLLYNMFCGVSGGLLTGFASGTAIIGVFFGIIFGLSSVYMITEDFAQWTVAPLRRGRTWLILLLIGLFIGVLSACIFMIVRIVIHGVIGAFLVSFKVALAVIVLVLVMWLIAIIAGVNVYLLIRVVFGILGGVPISNIVTEDFTRWSLLPLRYWPTWRDVLRSGFEGGVAGYIMLSIFCIFSMPIFGN